MKNKAIECPDWLARNAVYQINPRTFTKEGTISAITAELEFLKGLGFNIIYLCPIFEEDATTDPKNISPRQKKSKTNNPKNPYRMRDYYFIDSEYGTADDLKELIEKAHALDMRVLLDLVYAHIGEGAPIIKRNPEFVEQNPDGSFIYTGWNFPKLNFACEGLREYLYTNMLYYVSAFDVDGFRCDIGDVVPLDFWQEARRRMRTIKKDAVLINEGIEYFRLETAFDSSYCYDWHGTLYDIFCEGAPAYTLKDFYLKLLEELPEGALILRDIDNHDTVTDWEKRVEVATKHNGMEQIEVINYLIDGIPMVYCGNELACTAKLSMFANRFYMGDFETSNRNKEKPQAKKRMEIFKFLNKLKCESDLLRYGETEWFDLDRKDSVIAFKRTQKENEVVFIGNSTDSEIQLDLPENYRDYSILLENNSKIADEKIILNSYGYIVFER